MTLEELLRSEGRIVYRTKGCSMMPMLRENRDVVVIREKKPGERAQKNDVALFRRPGQDHYVLHRVVKVEKNGYTMLGDHQWRSEKHVPEAAVFGILESFTRDGREYTALDPQYLKYIRKN